VPDPLRLTAQPTPNVNAMKYVLNRRMTEGRSQTFTDPRTATSLLARDLLGVAGVRQVFFLNDFITVTRHEGVVWDDILPKVEALMQKHLAG
jgi:Scaffold protein Nfu/NifU N terminal